MSDTQTHAAQDRTVRDRVANDHVVQFLPSDQSAAKAVAAFIARTCANGDHFLIVVRSRRWQAVTELLQEQQVLTDLATSDRLLVLDAEEMLQAVMRDGMPDARLFNESMGQRVARVTRAGGHLRIYLEMVDILAERDNFAAAHALEQLWNELGNAYHFTLLCGYSPERFASPAGWEELQTMCTAHARILPT